MKLKILAISAVTILMLTATAGEREVNDERLSEERNKGTVADVEEDGRPDAGFAESDVPADGGNVHDNVSAGTDADRLGRIIPIPVREEINNDGSSNGGNEDAGEAARSGETGSVQDGTSGGDGTSGHTDPADDGLGAGTDLQSGQLSDTGAGAETEPASGDPQEPLITPEGTDGDYETELGDNGGYSDGTEEAEYEYRDTVSEAEVNEPEMEYLGDFTVTGYCSCYDCCKQWSGSPCADGNWPVEGYTCAMGGVDFGTVLYIDGVGYRTVHDRGTEYGWVDLYFESHQSALDWGQQVRSVWVVR